VAAYLHGGCKMEKKFTKDLTHAVFYCRDEKKFKSTRCKVLGMTCNCSLEVIQLRMEGIITFPEGAEKVALEAFGLTSLEIIK
jgi:hypothetical protein